MPVQKSRKTPSKRGMHRSHDAVAKPALSIDPQSGETHLRHRITPEATKRLAQTVTKIMYIFGFMTQEVAGIHASTRQIRWTATLDRARLRARLATIW